jgi:hypothetical protein
MKIFGKDPAFWSGVVQAVLLLLLSFNQIAQELALTDERVGLIVALLSAVFAVYTAYVTRDAMLAFVHGAAKAVIALLAAYNLELTVDQIAAILGIMTIIAGVVQRDRTAPLVVPMFNNPPDAPTLTGAPPHLARAA